MEEEKIPDQVGSSTQRTEMKTERFEQEVTIHLDVKEDEDTVAARLETNNWIQYEETIKKIINSETDWFFLDFGFHLCSLFCATLAVLGTANWDISKRYIAAIITYCVVAGGFSVVKMVVNKKEAVRKSMCIVEILWLSTIIVGCFYRGKRVFYVPFLLNLMLFITHIGFYCLNLANSIDQTFLFKLVLEAYLV